MFVKCRDSALSGCPDVPSRDQAGARGAMGAAAPPGARDLAKGLADQIERLLRLGHMRWYAIRPEHGLGFDRRRMVIWYAAFAIYAGAVTICSGGGADGAWGVWATVGLHPHDAVEGRGESRIGAEILRWEPHDIFVAPSWLPVSHRAEDEAVLFSYSDRPVQQKLGLWREQRGNA